MVRNSVQEIVDFVAGKHGLSRQETEVFVATFFELINDGLHSDKVVKVKGLGTFKVIDVRERESVNVNTGERVVIGGHGKITFTPDPVMRDLVNKPFAQFETVILNDNVDMDEFNRIQVVESSDYEDKENSGINDDNVLIGEDEDINGSVLFQNEYIALENNDNSVYVDNVFSGENAVVEENEAVDGMTFDKKVDYVENAEEPGEAHNQEISHENVVNIFEKERQVSLETEADNVSVDDINESFFWRHKWICLALIFLFVAGLAFLSGYHYCKYVTTPQVKYVKVYAYKKRIAEQTLSDSVIKTDIENDRKDTLSVSRDKFVTNAVEKMDVVDPEIGNNNISADSDFVLRNAKAMVNTGAYRITGTEKTITVKKGESLKQISKFYFGDGMECYIQVYNGVTEVKEGQRLKIPKLENKKKRQ